MELVLVVTDSSSGGSEELTGMLTPEKAIYFLKQT